MISDEVSQGKLHVLWSIFGRKLTIADQTFLAPVLGYFSEKSRHKNVDLCLLMTQNTDHSQVCNSHTLRHTNSFSLARMVAASRDLLTGVF